jgi:hypothetical protein
MTAVDRHSRRSTEEQLLSLPAALPATAAILLYGVRREVGVRPEMPAAEAEQGSRDGITRSRHDRPRCRTPPEAVTPIAVASSHQHQQPRRRYSPFRRPRLQSRGSWLAPPRLRIWRRATPGDDRAPDRPLALSRAPRYRIAAEPETARGRSVLPRFVRGGREVGTSADVRLSREQQRFATHGLAGCCSDSSDATVPQPTTTLSSTMTKPVLSMSRKL